MTLSFWPPQEAPFTDVGSNFSRIQVRSKGLGCRFGLLAGGGPKRPMNVGPKKWRGVRLKTKKPVSCFLKFPRNAFLDYSLLIFLLFLVGCHVLGGFPPKYSGIHRVILLFEKHWGLSNPNRFFV